MKRDHSKGERILGRNALPAAAAVVIVFAGLREAQALLLPFVLSAFLSVLSAPFISWLRSKRVPTIVAVGLVAVCIMAVLMSVATVVGGLLNEFVNELNRYREGLGDLRDSVVNWLVLHGLEVSAEQLPVGFDPATLLDLVVKGLRGITSALSGTVLVLLATMFMLFETTGFRDKIDAAIGTGVDLRRFAAMSKEVQRYLVVKTAMSCLTGLIIWGWAEAMGVEFAFLWGLLAFLLNYVPVIGSIMAAVPAVLLCIVQLGPGSSLLLGCGYIVVNVSVSNFLEPVLMGRRLGLSPLVVFLSLVFWGWLWGPVGMLLSVPLTMVAKILMENSESFGWIAVFLGSRPRPRSMHRQP